MLQSVQTALRVFEVVAKSESVGVSEVARHLDISKSTAQRCLRALHGEGWIKVADTAGTTRWAITSKAFSLGQRVAEQGRLREMALPVMRKLWDAVHEAVHLTVVEGRKAVLIETQDSPDAIRVQLPRGAWAPLHVIPSGKVLLAYASEEFREEYLRDGLTPLSETTVTDPKQMRKDLDQVRHQGWSVVVDELVKGASGLAAPVFDRNGHVVAALAITLLTARFPASVRKKYISQVVECAAEISRALKSS